MSTPADASSRPARIQRLLTERLSVQHIDVIDDSHLHAGHAGARDGRGHYRVRIVAKDFEGLRPIQRHQLVFRTLDDMMQTDIHALSITALTPDEAR